MSRNSSSYAITLTQIVSNITLYVDSLTLIFGIIGGICNLITFTGQLIRQSSTVFYLLCATIFQLLTILICVTIRLAVDHTKSNIQNQSIVFCKLRLYFSVTLPGLVSYYTCLATLDRYFSISKDVRIRAYSQIKIAKRWAAATLIIVLLMSIHIPILHNIYYNACQISPGSIYNFIFAAYSIIIITVLPNVLMLIFSLITVYSIRKSRQQIAPAIVTHRSRTKRLETKLLRIIVIQMSLSILFSLLRIGSYSYRVITDSVTTRTVDQTAAGYFAFQLGASLYFFNCAVSFYALILSSKFFRKTFYERILFFYRRYRRQLLQQNL